MRIERFEDIEAWKEARLLVKNVYTRFAECRDYGFRDQIQRAAVSTMANIAEGFDRGSNKEFIQFLIISRGSVSEVRSLTYAAQDIGYLDSEQCNAIQEQSTRLSNLLNGFIRYLRNSERIK
ncbi:four helix bundle protein [Geobacter sp. AOG1]|uniref:four helix bundle protein n=1 Tax=Geobacter sp. AOG1 TaxID=1566346 RepID=UPI001CC7CA8A|nr:four helix bundle protein [Geobacter sp. AOG1]GFE58652.1 four helix bundle protein [Geobacter sp. AOG1]